MAIHRYPFTEYSLNDGLHKEYPFTVNQEVDISYLYNKIKEINAQQIGSLEWNDETELLTVLDPEGNVITTVHIPLSEGSQGPVGPQGPQGIQGEPGPQGERGPQGIQGIQGPKGDRGPQGVQGIQGPKGDKGDVGPVGPQGAQGIQGIKGDKGDTGNAGPKGDKGDTGNQGPKGDTGNTGPQGETGPAGPTGAQGPQGVQGIQGPKGDPGDSLKILGKYNTLAALEAAHPTGNAGDLYQVGEPTIPDTLSELTDVNITTPTDGQVLKYDNASSKWINGNSTGGLSSDVITDEFDTEPTVVPNVYDEYDIVRYNNTWYWSTASNNTDTPGTSAKWQTSTNTTIESWGASIPAYGLGYYSTDREYYVNTTSSSQWVSPSQGQVPGGVVIGIYKGNWSGGSSSYHNYNIGDYVIYQNSLYKCIGATTGESWDSTKWTETQVMSEIPSGSGGAVTILNLNDSFWHIQSSGCTISDSQSNHKNFNDIKSLFETGEVIIKDSQGDEAKIITIGVTMNSEFFVYGAHVMLQFYYYNGSWSFTDSF